MLRIKNWRRYQHYTDRNPPWIKLHFEILSSADWVMLDDASRLLAVVCMLVASKHEGEIPDSCSPAYFQRLAHLDHVPNFKPLIECGFLVGTLADDSKRKHTLAGARPEKETETETEKTLAQKLNGNHSAFDLLWQAYPNKKSKRTAEKAYLRALKQTSHEAIMAALERAKRSDRRFRDIQFTPYLASWLNAGGWDDEADKPSNPFHQDWRTSIP